MKNIFCLIVLSLLCCDCYSMEKEKSNQSNNKFTSTELTRSLATQLLKHEQEESEEKNSSKKQLLVQKHIDEMHLLMSVAQVQQTIQTQSQIEDEIRQKRQYEEIKARHFGCTNIK